MATATNRWADQSASPGAQWSASPPADADRKASSIATYERLSGLAWIGIGVVQVLLVYTILAGIWNIVAGISRLRIAPAIERRHWSVPDAFSGVGQLLIIGAINLFFGAAFGVIMVVVVDFIIRQYVLDNRHIFTGGVAAPAGAGGPGNPAGASPGTPGTVAAGQPTSPGWSSTEWPPPSS